MEKFAASILLIIGLNQYLHAQLNISTLDSTFIINFDSSVAGVNTGDFDGGGFASEPSTGQLDSDGIIVTGMSDGDLDFGTAGSLPDFAQGVSQGGVNTGGVYAFVVSDQNSALGLQPTITDWTPGAVILKVTNTTGGNINKFDITYKVYSYNDQDRASTVEFYYSTDNLSYHRISGLNFTTVQLKDELPAWNSVLKSLKISAALNNGEELFLKWSGSDASGNGSRDEMALDDITVAAHYEDIKLIITEVADHSTSEEEYVEIFNGGSGDVDIDGWRLIERYNANNDDSREIILNAGSQKNSGGSGYLNLTRGEYAVIVRRDYNSLKSTYELDDQISIFENFWPPAMTGDERYILVNAVGDVIDNFGAWVYEDGSSFRLEENKCYERINITGDGELEDNWKATASSVYYYTPGSGNITPLPVELLLFYARIKNDIVILYWQTASEINNYGFEVERKTISNRQVAGEKQSGWELTGFVPGHGSSHSPKNYSFNDYPDKSKIYLYRLKQIDVNGNFDYSKSVKVSFHPDRQQIKLFQNYPNPISTKGGTGGNTTTMIKYIITENNKQYPVSSIRHPASGIRNQVSISLKVFDILGREVATLVNESHSPGDYKIEFDGGNLPSGIYYYTIETSRGSISKKMIILK